MGGLAEWRARQRQGPSRVVGADKLIDPAALGADISDQAFILDGRQVDANLANIVVGGSIRTTIDGASTLDLDFVDDARWLLRSRLLKSPADLSAVGLDWRLAGVEYSTATGAGKLRFEDLIVAELRRRNKPRKIARDAATRARFIKMLVDELPREIRPKFVCPQIDRPQPIGKARQERDADRTRGIPSGAKLKIRGAAATPAQLAVMELHLDVVETFEDATTRVMLATAMIVINETGARNLPGSSDGLSRGAMQLRTDIAAPNGIDNMDMEAVCRFWLTEGAAINMGAIEYAHTHPSATPAEIARAVWGGTGFSVSTWTRWADEVRALVDAYGGHSSDRGRGGGEEQRYEFSRGRPGGPKGENTWEASLRLVEEVGWRRFVVRERFYCMAEEDLILSRPRATIELDTEGIDDVGFDIDGRQEVNELRIDCRAKLWKAPPGSVIMLADDYGPAAGRWLVSEIDRDDLFGLDSEISLRRGAALYKDKPEPPAEQIATSIGFGDIAGGSGRESKARAVYEAAKRFTGPYKFGGGHGPPLSSLSPSDPLDCSSSTSLALWMAGAMEGDVAQVSGWFQTSYGEPGEGEFITIWAHGNHVFITGQLDDVGYWRFDTGQNGSNGPRLVTSERSTAGFTPRHPA